MLLAISLDSPSINQALIVRALMTQEITRSKDKL